jgi:acetyl esterase/lipase
MEIHENASIAHATRHDLSDADRERVAVMRQQFAPFKGKMGDPSARGAFDEVMEKTPDAPGVAYEAGVVGGISGVRCVPRNARPGAAILYLHGGAYLLGSARAYRHFVGQFAARTGTTAFIAEYRLAPEHAFPAAVDDARAAYRGLVEDGAQRSRSSETPPAVASRSSRWRSLRRKPPRARGSRLQVRSRCHRGPISR